MASGNSLAVSFSRAARLALAGLLVPQLAVGLIAGWGAPLRSGVSAVLLLGALAGFASAGAMAGHALGRGPRVTGGFALGLTLAGGFVTPVFQDLRGLTGREPVLVVVPIAIAAFAAGFGLAGIVGSAALAVPARQAVTITARAALAGAAGGAVALAPVLLAQARLSFDGSAYLVLFVAVASFLACVIVPFRWMGVAIEREVGPPAAAGSLDLRD